MSLRTRIFALAALCLPLCLPALARAANPQLRLPAFDHLQRTATESVNITLGPAPLALAAWVMKNEKGENAAARELLRGLRTIAVRSYEFPEDNMYSQADIDAVRDQLSAPGWTALARVRQRHEDAEDVDIYVSMDNDKVTGLAIVAMSPRKFTIVNVVGSIDPSLLASLEDRLGLPALPM